MCRRAFKIIHYDDVCDTCDLRAVIERRFMLSMRLFMKVKKEEDHVLRATGA